MELDMPDIRPINDAYASDDIRSIDMVRLGVALWDYPTWDIARRVRWAQALAARTVELFGSSLPKERGDALLTMVVTEWVRIAAASAAP